MGIQDIEQTKEPKEDDRIFVFCEKCGKRLIERLPNGLWKFLFGKKPNEAGKPPVEMYIMGSIRIKCLRRRCGHYNTLHYLPNVGDDN